MKKKKVNLRDLKPKLKEERGHNHSNPKNSSNLKTYLPAIFSFVMLMLGIAIDYFEAFPHWVY